MSDADAEMPEMALPSLLSWLGRGDASDLELACAEHPDPARGSRRHHVVRLPWCIAEVPDHLFVEIVAAGPSRLHLRLDGCDRPEESRARVEPVGALLAALDENRRVRILDEAPTGSRRSVLSGGSMPLGRRQMLLLGGRSDRDRSAAQLSHHQRLVAAVRRLAPPPIPAPAGTDALTGPGVVLTAPSCTACGVCTRSCPEHALDLAGRHTDDVDGPGPAVVVLHQVPHRCDGCGGVPVCVAGCPVGTLQVRAPRPWSALWDDGREEITRVRTVRCARCRVRFRVDDERPDAGDDLRATSPGEALCPACAQRRSDPFGSALPPEALRRLNPEVVRALGYGPDAQGPSTEPPKDRGQDR